MRRPCRPFVATACLILLALGAGPACDEGKANTQASPAPATAAPTSPSTAPTAAPPSVPRIVSVGSNPIGDIACDGRTLMWSSSSSSDPKMFMEDRISVADVAGRGPHLVATATHGGRLGVPSVSGSWVAFVEYQQDGASPYTQFWYVRALNLSTGQALEVASARQRPATQELPLPSLSGNILVWDELLASGQKVLQLLDLQTSARRTLALPGGAYPVFPQVDGDNVVFLDNSTDPHHASEGWFARAGKLEWMQLSSGRTTSLDEEPLAEQPHLAATHVVWHKAVADPDHGGVGSVLDVRDTELNGAGTRVIGPIGGHVAVTPSHAAWWNDHAHRTVAYAFGSGRSTSLDVEGLRDAPIYAACGNRLYFAASTVDAQRGINAIELPA